MCLDSDHLSETVCFLQAVFLYGIVFVRLHLYAERVIICVR